MNGETDLGKLLKNMKPELNQGEYVYCLVSSHQHLLSSEPLCSFHEKEGWTMILPRDNADSLNLSYSTVCAWITLTVHSALEAVGLTAAVSLALAESNISCNMVAAFYHDHLFVPVKDAKRAMEALQKLSESNHE